MASPPLKLGDYAVVVIAHDPEIQDLRKIASQLQFTNGHRFLVDNCSRNSREVKYIAAAFGFSYIRNSNNLGIAAALNSLEALLPEHIVAIIAFDQDSFPQLGYCEHLFQLYRRASKRGNNIAAVGGLVIDTPSYTPLKFVRVRWHGVQTLTIEGEHPQPDFLIISGTLVSRVALIDSGGYDEQLFVDNVDVEWSYRVRSLGYKLMGTSEVFLLHRIGESLINLKPLGTTLKLHSAQRTEIMTKSRFLSYRKDSLPLSWKIHDLVRFVCKTLITVAASRDRLRRINMVVSGAAQGLREPVATLGPRGRRLSHCEDRA